MSGIGAEPKSASSSAASGDSGLGSQLESFREVRRNLEASILPLATSVDGRRFSFQVSLHGLELQVGGYVVLEDGGTRRLGQVLTLELDQQSVTELTLPGAGGPEARTQVQVRYARGEGAILEGDWAPFHDALARVATGTEVQAWLERSGRHSAKLRLGELALVPGVPCLADAGGFDRHTFLCGQSGSGKTYSLGVILERLLIETDLRLVVLDPNSDFVSLGQVRADADPALAERYAGAARGVAVYSAGAPAARRLRLHVADIDPAMQAALLRLDPVNDREEYTALSDVLASGRPLTLEALTASSHPEARRLGLRVRSLGVDRFSVWAPGESGSVLDAVRDPGIRRLGGADIVRFVDHDQYRAALLAPSPQVTQHRSGDKCLLLARRQGAKVNDDTADARIADRVQDRTRLAGRPDREAIDAQAADAQAEAARLGMAVAGQRLERGRVLAREHVA